MKVGLLEIIYIVLTFQLLVFSVFLFSSKAKKISNYILGVQLFSQAAGIFSGFTFIQIDYFYEYNPHLFFLGYSFMFLWGPTFYLYVKSAAYKDFRLKFINILDFLPFIIISLYIICTYLPLSSEEKRFLVKNHSYPIYTYSFYLDMFVRVQVFFYIIKSILVLFSIRKKLKENFSSIPKTNFYWIQFLIIGFISSFLLTVPLIIIFSYLLHMPGPFLTLAVITPYFIYFNIIFYKAWYQPELFAGVEENVKYKSSKLTKEEAENWIVKLNNFVEINKPHLNPDLTLNQLAEDLEIPARVLSQIINEYFNQNFYDYINRLRIEESKRMLLDSSNKMTVLEILYEVGFNSKSTFNNIFKKMTGLTPTEYRKGNYHENHESIV